MPVITQNLKAITTPEEEALATQVLAAALCDQDEFLKLIDSPGVKTLIRKKILRYTIHDEEWNDCD